jgi:hypothetical protein
LRTAVTAALDKIGWRPDKDERGAAYWINKKEWDKCIEIGASAVVPLVAVLGISRGSFTHEVRERNDVLKDAATALGLIGDARAVEQLIAVLKEGDKVVRRAAAGSLVDLYRSGLLDKAQESLILAQRGEITSIHKDIVGSSCTPHTDSGIGVAFPV